MVYRIVTRLWLPFVAATTLALAPHLWQGHAPHLHSADTSAQIDISTLMLER